MKKLLGMILKSEADEVPREQVARRGERFNLRGRDAELIVDHVRFAIRLKDLSRTGAAGLTDAPLKAGENIALELDKDVIRPAHVRWTRVAMAGIEFDEPLSSDLLEKLRGSAGT